MTALRHIRTANCITKLPKAEHQSEERQAAMEALLLVVEQSGPTMFARIGVMQPLNRSVERVFDSSRKERHWENGSWHGIGDRNTIDNCAELEAAH